MYIFLKTAYRCFLGTCTQTHSLLTHAMSGENHSKNGILVGRLILHRTYKWTNTRLTMQIGNEFKSPAKKIFNIPTAPTLTRHGYFLSMTADVRLTLCSRLQFFKALPRGYKTVIMPWWTLIAMWHRAERIDALHLANISIAYNMQFNTPWLISLQTKLHAKILLFSISNIKNSKWIA